MKEKLIITGGYPGKLGGLIAEMSVQNIGQTSSYILLLFLLSFYVLTVFEMYTGLNNLMIHVTRYCIFFFLTDFSWMS